MVKEEVEKAKEECSQYDSPGTKKEKRNERMAAMRSNAKHILCEVEVGFLEFRRCVAKVIPAVLSC